MEEKIEPNIIWNAIIILAIGLIIGSAIMMYIEYNSAKQRDRKSTRLNSSHIPLSRMPSSA